MQAQRTRVQQRKLVDEGLAVGCLAIGLDELPNTSNFEWDFRRAWRAWSWSSRFPQVQAGPQRDDIRIHILAESARRQGVVLAYWTEDRTWTPRLTQEWSIDEFLEALDEDDVPGSAWPDLARLVRTEISRYPQ